jgi:hypothetical protein
MAPEFWFVAIAQRVIAPFCWPVFWKLRSFVCCIADCILSSHLLPARQSSSNQAGRLRHPPPAALTPCAAAEPWCLGVLIVLATSDAQAPGLTWTCTCNVGAVYGWRGGLLQHGSHQLRWFSVAVLTAAVGGMYQGRAGRACGALLAVCCASRVMWCWCLLLGHPSSVLLF